MSGEPTRDTLWRGELVFWQPARGHGYRFNLDPVLLAGFAPAAGHVLELGAGCGVLSVLLIKLGKAREVTAVEIQKELAALAGENAQENGLKAHIHVVCGDLRAVALPQVDAAVFNPPYVPAGRGNLSPEASRRAARHEQHGTLADFLAAAHSGVAPGGPISAILPARRGEELAQLCAQNGLRVARQRLVLPRAGSPARLCLFEMRRGASSTLHEPPLVVHAGKRFTPEVAALLKE